MGKNRRIDRASVERAVAFMAEHPELSIRRAAPRLGIDERTLRIWLKRVAPQMGIDVSGLESRFKGAPPPTVEVADELARLRREVVAQKAQLSQLSRDEMDAAFVRSKILGLAAQPPAPPEWLVEPAREGLHGVPMTLWSDWHWGEVVDPDQVNGVNAFNLEVARDRARTLVEKIIHMTHAHMVRPQYPGIVVNLGGDMVSGDIHEELSATNDAEIMPVVVDLFSTLIWCLDTLAGVFGRVFVPCVTGNHGRNTKKLRHKGRVYTSFDWLLYAMLERHFANDPRVTFLVAAGSDVLYRVHDHAYLLTHGDQFYGGDGIIGALGPIIRGDHRKRYRYGQLGQGYDTMLIGHWHQYMPLDTVTCNGSLVGYNEYASARNFKYEPPVQALWISHPTWGMTFRNPIYLERPASQADAPWVSWPEQGAKHAA